MKPTILFAALILILLTSGCYFRFTHNKAFEGNYQKSYDFRIGLGRDTITTIHRNENIIKIAPFH